jgi:hypothetical protein
LKYPGSIAIPWDAENSKLLSGASPEIEQWSAMAKWWKKNERLWEDNKKSNLTLNQRIDYQRGLSSQFPRAEHRVVYNKSGKHLYAAYLGGSDALIDQGLYWGAVESEEEAHFLCAVLNSTILEDLITPLMSSSKDERDFHKTVFAIRWAQYDPNNEIHSSLTSLGKRAAEIAAEVDVQDIHFISARGVVDEAIENSGVTQEIDQLVVNLFNQSSIQLDNFPTQGGSAVDSAIDFKSDQA